MRPFQLKIPAEVRKGKYDSEDETVSEALETVFSHEEEVLLYWGEYRIPLSIKWDISDMWSDICLLWQRLRDSRVVMFSIDWPTSSFFAHWEFERVDEQLIITASWTTVPGGKEALHAIRQVGNHISVPTLDFLKYWERLIRFLIASLEESGYSTKEFSDFPSEWILS